MDEGRKFIIVRTDMEATLLYEDHTPIIFDSVEEAEFFVDDVILTREEMDNLEIVEVTDIKVVPEGTEPPKEVIKSEEIEQEQLD